MSETKCTCPNRDPDEDYIHAYGCPTEYGCHLADIPGHDCALDPCEPAEPVIEVAPGEPTCEYCGPVCYRGAEHNARVEDGARYADDPVPAVPAQEAPRETGLSLDECQCAHCKDMRANAKTASEAEPQAGAQAPSQWIVANSLPGTVRNLAHLCVVLAAALRLADEHLADLADAWERGALSEHDGLGGTRSNRNSDVRKAIRAALSEGPEETQVPSQDELLDEGGLSVNDLGLMLAKERTEFVALQTHLNSIKAYAEESAKTPITREDMHDPLKAQTFYDEAKGFERLVLSEIGVGK